MERENYANPRWELHVWKVSSSKQWARRPPAHRHTHAHAYTHAHAVSSHTVRPCWTLWQDRLLCHHDQLGTAMDCGPQDSHPNMQYARYSEQSSLATHWKKQKTLIRPVGDKEVAGGRRLPFRYANLGFTHSARPALKSPSKHQSTGFFPPQITQCLLS